MSDLYAVLRVRGRVHVRQKTADTLRHIGLTRVNHLVLMPKDEVNQGMIKKAAEYVTWGEINKKTLKKLIERRGRLSGDRKITDDYVADNSEYNSLSEFTEKLLAGEAKTSDLKGMKKVFRLNPPVGGWDRKGIKKHVNQGGALGYRRSDVNKLIERMI
ncbi:MAG: 50S ribosomal protein L30 [Candidatus Altiarchaeales archaeon]|nr:50S ribosomal protein L30 [Candidatus Altiarchaeales archaeon]